MFAMSPFSTLLAKETAAFLGVDKSGASSAKVADGINPTNINTIEADNVRTIHAPQPDEPRPTASPGRLNETHRGSTNGPLPLVNPIHRKT
jgi:hypothetical protein